MKLLLAYGTRPEWLKLKPLIEKIKGVLDFDVLFTGQQENIASYKLGHRIKIKKGANRLDSIICSILNQDNVFAGITHTVVQGDTTTALGVALAAFHRQIKIIHLEAGLRTFDITPYPEEKNRILIDALSGLHLCPTKQNAKNLLKEGHDKKTIFITGNTGLDNLKGIKTSYGNKVMVTMHRRENHHKMREWFLKINEVAKNNPDLEFLLPIHPNPNVLMHRPLLKHVKVIEPMAHEQMIKLIAECRFLITDSGGIQEEASFLNKKAIVCRDSTERNEILNIHTFLCSKPEKLQTMVGKIKNRYKPSTHYCPYGTGNSSEKVFSILKKIDTPL